MCCPQQFDSVQTVDIRLSVTFKDEKVDVDGEWSKEKLLTHLQNKLQKKNYIFDLDKENITKTIDNIIKNGIYSEAVLSKLLKNGMSKEIIIKAMKYGLQNLSCEELNYYCSFNITYETNLQCIDFLMNTIDEELIEKLRNIGLSKHECLNIIVSGLIDQNDCCLFQLTLNGIVTTKILNWEGPIIKVTEGIVKFLKKFDVDDKTLEFVKEKGITQETEEILYDLGYIKSSEPLHVCVCNIQIKEEIERVYSVIDEELEQNSLRSMGSNSIDKLHEIQKNKILEKKNYLRQNVMVPLTWAISKTLKYNPTNPIHYIACQLIRWKNNSIDPKEINETLDFVIDATMKKDKRLVEEKQREKKDKIKANDNACQHCLDQMELHRIKECCWKCTKKWVPKFSKCEFPELCSFCKLSTSKIFETTSLDRYKMSTLKTIPNLSKEIYNKYKTYSLIHNNVKDNCTIKCTYDCAVKY